MQTKFFISIAFFLFLALQSVLADELCNPVVLIIGTRPDAIKMLPLYKALQQEKIPTLLCSTGQHKELLDNIFDIFQVKPDVDFKIMSQGQDLFYITENVLKRSREFFLQVKPSLILVQGDTSSAMAAALAAFYLKIPIGHIEAGLRSENLFSPFPEELNRRFISLISTYHFAPTTSAVSHLLEEGISKEAIFCVGNTVVDSLQIVREKILQGELHPSSGLVATVEKQRADGNQIMLLTAHRRESFEGGLQKIFQGVKKALEQNSNLYVIYPAHPNPTIQKIIHDEELSKCPNLQVIAPLPYHDLIYLLNASDGVITDSGGIQEEAASLKKMTLIVRNETDRPEAISTGYAYLAGTDEEKIALAIQQMISKSIEHRPVDDSPYGDGHASEHIVSIIKKLLAKENT